MESIYKQLKSVQRRYGSSITNVDTQVFKAKKAEDSTYLLREYAFLRFISQNSDAVVPGVHFVGIYPELSSMSIERMDGDCQEWLKHPHDDREWVLLFLWVLYAVYTMDLQLGIIHQDFVYRNICIQACSEDYHFVIEGKEFKIASPGVRFRAIDFESACFAVSDTCRVKCSAWNLSEGVKHI